MNFDYEKIKKSKKSRIKYKAGFKYQLSKGYKIKTCITGYDFETDWFILFEDGTLYIKKGYAWDGPSGPTIDTKTFMRGSLVHDVLYQCMRMELLPESMRPVIDNILYEICIEDGMWSVRAWWVLKGVQKGAKNAAHPDHKRKEYTAP